MQYRYTLILFLILSSQVAQSKQQTFKTIFLKNPKNIDRALRVLSKKGHEPKVKRLENVYIFSLFVGPFKEKSKWTDAVSFFNEKKINHKPFSTRRVIVLKRSVRDFDKDTINQLQLKIAPLGLKVKKHITKKREDYSLIKYKIQRSFLKTVKAKKNKKKESFLKGLSGEALFFPQHFRQSSQTDAPVIFKIQKKKELSSRQFLQLGLMIDSDFEDVYFDSNQLSYSYQFESSKLSLGGQVVSWGRLFDDSLLGGFQRQNYRHGPQLDVRERSLDQLVLRFEHYLSNGKIDMVFSPYFRPHRFSDKGQSWSLVDQKGGEAIFMNDAGSNPIVSEVIQKSSIEEQKFDRLAYGLYLNYDFSSLSIGFAALKTPSLTPYYSVNPETLALLQQVGSVDQALLQTGGGGLISDHPELFTVATDGVLEAFAGVLRWELAFESGTPVTLENLSVETKRASKWNLEYESYFRGEKDTFNLVFSGVHIDVEEPILDYKNRFFLTGRYLFKFEKWQLNSQILFRYGIEPEDHYLKWRWVYTGFDSHVIGLGFEHFSGEDFTLGGYYERFQNFFLFWKHSF